MKTLVRLMVTALAFAVLTFVVGARPAQACPCDKNQTCEKKQGETPKSAPAKDSAPKYFDKTQPEGTKATCPVMGEALTVGKDTKFSEYKGKFVYFCCPGCKTKFDKEPAKYLPELK